MIEKLTLITLLGMFIFIAVFLKRKNENNKTDFNSMIRLLPFWLKLVGIVIIILALFIHWNDLSEQTTLGALWQFILGLGLLFVCLTKEKKEDELVNQVRLNTFFIAFFLGIIIHISIMLVDKLINSDANEFNILYSTNYILIVYIFLFYGFKIRLQK